MLSAEDRLLAANRSGSTASASTSQASHSASDLLLFSDTLQHNAEEAAKLTAAAGAAPAAAVAAAMDPTAAKGCLPTTWTGTPADYRLRE